MPNGNLGRLEGNSLRRYAPIGVGVAWFALAQGAGFVIGASGHPVNPILWRGLSVAMAGVASLISRSHVLKLSIRLVSLRFLHSLGLTNRASY